MAQTLLIIFILLHGLIHLTGFVKSFNIAGAGTVTGKLRLPVPENRYRTTGILWLGAGLTFLISGMAVLMLKPWWWMLATAALILSQVLIIIYWKEAKWGTIANVLILPVLIVSCATWCFNKMAGQEVGEIMVHNTITDHTPISKDMTVRLPAPVQKWLLHSGVVGKEAAHTVHLKQKGAMCTEPSGTWMPTEAEQYFTTDDPAFVWNAKVHVMPGITLAGRDKYVNGKGNMLIKAMGLIPMVNASGAQIDQGSMLRFLAEMCWFPSAALSPYVKWESLDSTEAKATMTYKGLTVSGNYKFSHDGDFLSFSAKRYMDNKGHLSLEDWYIPANEWKEMDGIRIPVRGVVTWKLNSGDFEYYKWEVTDIAYNKTLM